MGERAGDARAASVRSLFARQRAVRNCLRALVFTGALGAAWLIGSSVASADEGVDQPVDGIAWLSDSVLDVAEPGGLDVGSLDAAGVASLPQRSWQFAEETTVKDAVEPLVAEAVSPSALPDVVAPVPSAAVDVVEPVTAVLADVTEPVTAVLTDVVEPVTVALADVSSVVVDGRTDVLSPVRAPLDDLLPVTAEESPIEEWSVDPATQASPSAEAAVTRSAGLSGGGPFADAGRTGGPLRVPAAELPVAPALPVYPNRVSGNEAAGGSGSPSGSGISSLAASQPHHVPSSSILPATASERAAGIPAPEPAVSPD